DDLVTGVQTCALPISGRSNVPRAWRPRPQRRSESCSRPPRAAITSRIAGWWSGWTDMAVVRVSGPLKRLAGGRSDHQVEGATVRSEEGRGGKRVRTVW